MFKNARKVHVEGQVYYWTIVKTSVVQKGNVVTVTPARIGIHTPDGKNFFPTFGEVFAASKEMRDKEKTGKSLYYKHDASEKPLYNPSRYTDGLGFGPGDVKEYIIKHIHGK